MTIVSDLLFAVFPPRCESIRELSPGRRARVKGKVVARDLIESTLTGERCVYYHYSVEEWRNTHMAGLASDGFWALSRYDEAIVEFYVQDEQGDRIIVAPQNIRIKRKFQTPQLVDIGVVGQRASELIIRTGDIVEIEGEVALVDDLYDQDRNYRRPVKRLIMFAGEGDVLDLTL